MKTYHDHMNRELYDTEPRDSLRAQIVFWRTIALGLGAVLIIVLTLA